MPGAVDALVTLNTSCVGEFAATPLAAAPVPVAATWGPDVALAGTVNVALPDVIVKHTNPVGTAPA